MKKYLYDFLGYNQHLFERINEYFNAHDHILLHVLHYVGNYRFFPLVFLLFYLYLAFKKKTNTLPESELLTNKFLSFFFTVMSAIIIIGVLKELFAFSRPFCTEGVIVTSASTTILKEVSCFESFPSGHTTYFASILFGGWTILNRFFKCIGVLILFAVALARIAAGAHFPADLFWGIVVAILLAFISHKLVLLIPKRYKDIISSLLKF